MAATTRYGTSDTQYAHKYVYALLVNETAGSTASVALKNGGTSGDVVYQCDLAADSNAGFTLSVPMLIGDGVYVDVTGGVHFTLVAE